MCPDATTIVLRSLDSPHSTGFGTDDVASWPTGALDAFVGAGILVEGSYATTVTCRECPDGCIVEVHFAGGDGRELRAFTECSDRDDIGRVRIPLDRLRTWTLSQKGLAAWVAGELGATAAVEEILEGRLWWLGGPEVNQRRLDAFLAKGANWSDAQGVFAHVGRLKECSAPLIIVPSRVPTNYPFGAAARVISLARLLRVENDVLELDKAEIARTGAKRRSERAQDVRRFETPPGTRWNQVLIELVADRMVRITIGTKQESRTYEDLGFVDRRTQAEQPDKLWERFIWLAENSGCPDWDDIHSLGIHFDLLKKEISDIRKRLKSYFNIPDNPFERYRADQPYKTKFILEDCRRSSR